MSSRSGSRWAPVNSSCSAARNGARPVIRMLDWQNALPDSLSVYGEAGSWFTLDGIVVVGRGVQLDGEMAGAVIRHATLVPGWAMHCDCEPKRPTEPSVRGERGRRLPDDRSRHHRRDRGEPRSGAQRSGAPSASATASSTRPAPSARRSSDPAASARTRTSRSRAAPSSGRSRSSRSNWPRTAFSWGRSGSAGASGAASASAM